MQVGRFKDAIDLMKHFQKLDPGNDRVPEFIKYLEHTQGIAEHIQKLEASRSSVATYFW